MLLHYFGPFLNKILTNNIIMIDPVTIGLIVGIVMLVIERAFKWGMKIHKSKCCGNEVEFESEQ
jgi:hypothetical protein